MNGPWSQSWMREICTSGLMSGIWKRNGMTVTAPDLDSTRFENRIGHRGIFFIASDKNFSSFCSVLFRFLPLRRYF